MITVHGGDYEHTLDLGRDGERVTYDASGLTALWGGIRNGAAFDVAEFSLANLMMMRDRGVDHLWALPIFPSRPFSHSSMLVARTSVMKGPHEFAGKRIGVPDYSMTAAVWARGVLAEEFGVSWRDIKWVSGQEQRFETPAGVDLMRTSEDIEDLCANGEIDGLIIPYAADKAKPRGERRLRTAITGNEAHERASFLHTGVRPINHVIIVHADLLLREPDAVQVVFDAYLVAKKRALKRRLGSTLMPWGDARWSEMLEMFGGDPFPYGLTPANRAVVEKLGSLLLEQGLIGRAPQIEEIFAPGALELREAAAEPAAPNFRRILSRRG